jgi:hypothetical protein
MREGNQGAVPDEQAHHQVVDQGLHGLARLQWHDAQVKVQEEADRPHAHAEEALPGIGGDEDGHDDGEDDVGRHHVELVEVGVSQAEDDAHEQHGQEGLVTTETSARGRPSPERKATKVRPSPVPPADDRLLENEGQGQARRATATGPRQAMTAPGWRVASGYR